MRVFGFDSPHPLRPKVLRYAQFTSIAENFLCRFRHFRTRERDAMYRNAKYFLHRSAQCKKFLQQDATNHATKRGGVFPASILFYLPRSCSRAWRSTSRS